jgi:hypothetical protein
MAQSPILRKIFEDRLGPLRQVQVERLRLHFGKDLGLVASHLSALQDERLDNARLEDSSLLKEVLVDVAEGAARLMSEISALQIIADQLSRDLETVLVERLNIRLDRPFYVAALETGSFNARIESLPEGHLILLNTGMMSFCHLVSKILWAGVIFTEFDADGAIVAHSGAGQPVFSLETLNEAIADAFEAYIRFGSATYARRLPALGGVRGFLAEQTTNTMEFFVLAHEYGHVVNGDLTDSSFHLSDGAHPSAHLRTDELNADMWSWNCTMSRAEQADRAAPLVGLTAVTIVFTVEDMLVRLAAKVRGTAVAEDVEHPRGDERLFALLNGLEIQPRDLEVPQAMRQWLLDREFAIQNRFN